MWLTLPRGGAWEEVLQMWLTLPWLTLPRGGAWEEVLLQQTIPSNHKAVLPKGSTTHLLQQSPFLKGVPATEVALTVFPDNPSRKTTNPALGVNFV